MATDGLRDRPWLLLPGTLCTQAVFDPLLDRIGVQSRQSVPIDRPAMDAYADIFDGLDPETVVCGFSLGAIVAAHHADRITAHRLVFFGLNPRADDPAKAPSRHALAREVQAQGGAALQDRLGDVFGPDPDSTRATIMDMADRTAPMIDAQTHLAISRPGALPALARARTPVICLTGTHDSAAPPDLGRAAAAAAPSGLFGALKGLGHFSLLEDPAACEAALRYHDARDTRKAGS